MSLNAAASFAQLVPLAEVIAGQHHVLNMQRPRFDGVHPCGLSELP